ncbi:MAG: RtcB family protein [Planctomycetaceae bacterium]|nr:RtcB family protein [Planctomycetaceae bacterium]
MTRTDLPEHVHLWLADPLSPEVLSSLQRLSAAVDVQQVAVMPDVHLASNVCVGVAVATRERIYPQAVGGDIGCGMAAVAFDAEAGMLDNESAAARVLAGLYAAVPCNRHHRRSQPEPPPELFAEPLSHPRLESIRARDGRVQFGTLGRGNHFVELQRDETDRLWLMVHSGSRGLGQAITTHHLHRADRENTLPGFWTSDQQGQDYRADADWAERYAFANRDQMIHSVAGLLAAEFAVACDWSTLIHESHNHVRSERHGNEELLVHRKGALPAATGRPGVIPGSMGTLSFHVEGRGLEAALCSSSHGAGRLLTRTEARRQIERKQLTRELRDVWFDHRRMESIAEEAPSAARNIRKVMQAQRELTRITRHLKPIICYKGW